MNIVNKIKIEENRVKFSNEYSSSSNISQSPETLTAPVFTPLLSPAGPRQADGRL